MLAAAAVDVMLAKNDSMSCISSEGCGAGGCAG
jgi:hypothetical protein